MQPVTCLAEPAGVGGRALAAHPRDGGHAGGAPQAGGGEAQVHRHLTPGPSTTSWARALVPVYKQN